METFLRPGKSATLMLCCISSLSLLACERAGNGASALEVPHNRMSSADKPAVPTFVFAKGPSKNTFVTGRAEDHPRTQQEAPTPDQAERDRAADARFRAAARIAPISALTTAPLPEGVLALIYRAPESGEPGTILMSTASVSPEIKHMAWIALNEDITRHPAPATGVERTIELRADFSIRFPEGDILQLQVLTRAPENAADEARWNAKEEADRRSMIDSFNSAPQETLHGFDVRLRRG